MLNLQRYITPNVPINETGTATLGINVARRFRKKRNTTSMTRLIEMIRVRSTSRTDARIVVVRSSTTLTSMAVGMEALSDGIASRILSTVSMIFAPG